jgi:hypothetical protein
MPCMISTPDVFHADKSWLNDEARWNMSNILVTADVFQADKSWLNDVAL